MKVLACTDGSEHSKKALEKAALIAGGCKADDVAVIHVYEEKVDFAALPLFEVGATTRDTFSKEDVDRFRKIQEEHEKAREKVIADALAIFEKEGIKARAILKQGHPAETILETAAKEGFDIIVIGSRGLGGLKKLLLGSVSNAVIQEAKSGSVLMVK
ncbi:MAG: universal stress protein [Bacillota bacterium]|nr:universal stress protein [Bacillota bacterium]